MPFDPKRGGDGGFGGYVNPYAMPHSNPKNNKKPNYIWFVMIAVLLLGIVAGVLVSLKTSTADKDTSQPNTSVTDKSNYMEVEIFDVQQSE